MSMLDREATPGGLKVMSFVGRCVMGVGLAACGALSVEGHLLWALLLVPVVLLAEAAYIVAERELYRLNQWQSEDKR